MPGEEIRRGLVSDAADLAAFAARTFAEAFGEFTASDDMRAHLVATYRPDLQAREIADPTVITLLALQDARIVAYAQVRLNPSGASLRRAAWRGRTAAFLRRPLGARDGTRRRG